MDLCVCNWSACAVNRADAVDRPFNICYGKTEVRMKAGANGQGPSFCK